MRQRKKKIRQFLIIKEPHYIGKGVQYIYQFPNGMGASVVKFEIWRGRGSYGYEFGLYEMAQFRFVDGNRSRLSDVEGYLTPQDVIRKLEQISKMNPKGDF